MTLPKELTTITPLSKYLAMVVFVALPIVGFFLGMRYQEMINFTKNQQEKNSVSIERIPTPTTGIKPSPTPTISVLPTIDPLITANWKTYKNEKYGYSFKYPSDWYISPLTSDYVDIQNFYTSAGRGHVKDKGKYKIAISIFEKKSKTINELKTSLLAYYNSFDEKILNTTEIIINGNMALYVEYGQQVDQSTVEVYILDGNGTVVNLAQEIDTEGGKSYFDQILSTFKFTNQ